MIFFEAPHLSKCSSETQRSLEIYTVYIQRTGKYMYILLCIHPMPVEDLLNACAFLES